MKKALWYFCFITVFLISQLIGVQLHQGHFVYYMLLGYLLIVWLGAPRWVYGVAGLLALLAASLAGRSATQELVMIAYSTWLFTALETVINVSLGFMIFLVTGLLFGYGLFQGIVSSWWELVEYFGVISVVTIGASLLYKKSYS